MSKKEKKSLAGKYGVLALICLLLPAAAWYSEKETVIISPEGTLERNENGGLSREYNLVIEGDGLPENYDYHLSVEPARLTREEITACFVQAEAEIEASFFREHQTADHVTGKVSPMDTYADGRVEAYWTFSDYNLISGDGTLQEEAIPEEGCIIEIEAELCCQEVSEIYRFSMAVFPEEKTGSQLFLQELRAALAAESERTGTQEFLLPTQVGEMEITWKAAKQYLPVKVAVFEGIILVLLFLNKKEQEKAAGKARREAICLDYPEVVSKISILMGSGMSLKSAWRTIALRYEADHAKGAPLRPVYEEMLITLHQMEAGMTETMAYQQFGERTGVHSFLRLSRMLVQNQRKGTGDLCAILQKEAEEAFEERRLQARKLGEEAGTKMLAPLLLMMGIVIAIVIVPAIISFNMG